MADLKELSFATRTFVRMYRWRRIDPVPWTPLQKPIGDARLALITSGGMVSPGQKPFDMDVKGGDSSYRVIANDVDVRSLVEVHRSDAFDHAGIERDGNLAFPLDRLRELERDGVIGTLAPRHLSFMGSITAPGRLVRDIAPEAARLLVSDGVEAALLVPV